MEQIWLMLTCGKIHTIDPHRIPSPLPLRKLSSTLLFPVSLIAPRWLFTSLISAHACRFEMSEREQVQAEIEVLKGKSDAAEAAGLMDLVIIYPKRTDRSERERAYHPEVLRW